MTTTAASPTPVVQRPMAGVLAATTGVVLWGCLVPVAKKAQDVNGIVLGFHRLWIGAVAVGAYAMLVLVAFGYFYPIWTNARIPYASWSERIWFPGWF